MDSSSSYHTCASVDVSKLSPAMFDSVLAMANSNALTQRRVEFAENNYVSQETKTYCNVSYKISNFIFYTNSNKFLFSQQKKGCKYDNNSNGYDKENICNKNLVKVENADDTSFEFSMMRRRSMDEVCVLIKIY